MKKNTTEAEPVTLSADLAGRLADFVFAVEHQAYRDGRHLTLYASMLTRVVDDIEGTPLAQASRDENAPTGDDDSTLRTLDDLQTIVDLLTAQATLERPRVDTAEALLEELRVATRACQS